MLPSPAEQPAGFARQAIAGLLPWAFSTTTHVLLVLALVLNLRWMPVAWHGTGVERGIEVSIVSARDGDGGNGGADDAGPGTGEALPYDEPPLPSEIQTPPLAQTPPEPSGGGDDGELARLLSEPPSVNLDAAAKPKAPAPAIKLSSGTGGGSGGGAGSGAGAATAVASTSRPNFSRSGYARTGVFGVIGEGHKFVYVFDRSGSMDGHGGAPLSAAKRELIASLQDLGQTHQFQIIFYNEHPRIFSPSGVAGRLVFGTDQNKYLAQKFIGSITADGATRHLEALQMALRMAPDVIFFLTDADEPRITTEQLARINQLNQGTSINAIEFGYGAQTDQDNFLVRLAQQNGGQHQYVDVSQLPSPRRAAAR